MIPTPAVYENFPDILALNAESVHYLSPLSGRQLEHLHAQAAYHKVVVDGQRVAAFLMAFAPGVPYDSVNYQWFAARYSDFLYVDRIVVSRTARRYGLASLLYRDLFQSALERGFARVVCEFDIDPPNPASEAFHRRFGFTEVGAQRVAGGSKLVSMQSARVRALQTP